LFVKRENVFVVADTLTPRDDAEHRYEALFHLDATDAAVDEATKTVHTDGVAIMPQAGDRLAVEIVKGKEDEPVQGWAGGPWRAIPTAIYRKSGKGVTQFRFVLEPFAKGAQPAVRRMEKSGTGALAVRIVFAGGRALEIAPSRKADAVVLKRK
jgi:hypothetical protein